MPDGLTEGGCGASIEVTPSIIKEVPTAVTIEPIIPVPTTPEITDEIPPLRKPEGML